MILYQKLNERYRIITISREDTISIIDSPMFDIYKKEAVERNQDVLKIKNLDNEIYNKHVKSNNKSNNNIELTQDIFSKNFKEAINPINSNDINGLDNELLKKYFFIKLLEQEMFDTLLRDMHDEFNNNEELKKLGLHTCLYTTKKFFMLFNPKDLGDDELCVKIHLIDERFHVLDERQNFDTSRSHLLWEVYDLNKEIKKIDYSFFSLLMYIFGCSIDTAINIINNLLHNDNPFDIENPKMSLLFANGQSCCDVLLHALYRDKNIHILKYIQREYKRNGYTHYIFIIRWWDHIFCMQAFHKINTDILSIGIENGKKIPFFNQNLLYEPTSEDRYVFLCQDIRLAIRLHYLINNNIKFAKIIITAHLERDLSKYDWGFFYCKNVILICSPNSQCLSNINEYQKHLEISKAASFKIYPGFILPYNNNTSNLNTPLTEIEAKLFSQSIFLDKEKNIGKTIFSICNKAIRFEKFIQWGHKIGIFQQCLNNKKVDKLDEKIKFTTLKEIMKLPTEDSTELYWDTLITPSFKTLLWGPSNAGKSHVALSIGFALASGGETFGLRVKNSKKVVYLDGEGCEESFNTLATRFNINRDNTNFTYFRVSDFSLNKQEILNCIIREEINVVILDNILSIDQTAGISHAGNLLEFAKKLQKNNVAFIAVHHEDKAGVNFQGPSSLRDLSANSFYVKCVSNEIECLNNILKIEFEVLKWKRGTFLPKIIAQFEKGNFNVIHGNWTYFPKSNKQTYQNLDNISMISQTELQEENLPQLSKEELEVYEYIKNCKFNIKRAHIDENFKFDKSKSRKLLLSLIKKGLIESFNENAPEDIKDLTSYGKATAYRLKKTQ